MAAKMTLEQLKQELSYWKRRENHCMNRWGVQLGMIQEGKIAARKVEKLTDKIEALGGEDDVVREDCRCRDCRRTLGITA